MNGPLSGIRVIEIAGGGAVPFGCMMLADLGAEVIEIEAGAGQITRNTPGPNHKGESYHFLAYHRGKKSLYLDLGTETGKEAFSEAKKRSPLFDPQDPSVQQQWREEFEKPEGEDPEAEVVKELNYKHFVVPAGGKVCIATEGENPQTGRPTLVRTRPSSRPKVP